MSYTSGPRDFQSDRSILQKHAEAQPSSLAMFPPGELRQMLAKLSLATEQIEMQVASLRDKLAPVSAIRETGPGPSAVATAVPWERDFPLATEVGQELDAMLNRHLDLIARLQSLRESISL